MHALIDAKRLEIEELCRALSVRRLRRDARAYLWDALHAVKLLQQFGA